MGWTLCINELERYDWSGYSIVVHSAHNEIENQNNTGLQYAEARYNYLLGYARGKQGVEHIVCRVIVVIPAYNEERTVGHVIRSVRRNVHIGMNRLILVVDDGSTDNTVKAAIDAGVDIVVNHASNAGVCGAYETACHMSLEYGADIICSIDADGQFNPSEIDRLLEPIAQDEADVVIGSRFLREDSLTCVPTLNMITNCMIARVVSFLMGARLHDVESGFRAISKEAAESLELIGVGSFSHDMLLDLSSKGFRIKEVPVSVTYYRDRTSRVVKRLLTYGLKSAISIAVKVLTLKGILKHTHKANVTAKVVHESVRAVRSKEVQRLARIIHHE